MVPTAGDRGHMWPAGDICLVFPVWDPSRGSAKLSVALSLGQDPPHCPGTPHLSKPLVIPSPGAGSSSTR